MLVDVYYNLHKKRLSVRSRERNNYGKVINHTDMVLLKNCTFVVNPAGRKRVLKERRKNVHAFVRGELHMGGLYQNGKKIIYNPYKYSSFVFKDTKKPVTSADFVIIFRKDITAFNPV